MTTPAPARNVYFANITRCYGQIPLSNLLDQLAVGGGVVYVGREGEIVAKLELLDNNIRETALQELAELGIFPQNTAH